MILSVDQSINEGNKYDFALNYGFRGDFWCWFLYLQELNVIALFYTVSTIDSNSFLGSRLPKGIKRAFKPISRCMNCRDVIRRIVLQADGQLKPFLQQ